MNWQPPEIGDLRDRVQIQSRDDARDTLGETSPTAWTAVATVYARVEDVSSAETQQASKTTALPRVEVTLRYYPGLTPKHRLVTEAGRKLNIGGLTNPDRVKRFHVAQCTEVP